MRALLAGEQRAGAAEADRDFVGDQVHVELVAERAQAGQITRIVHAHAAGALHQRLDDDRADLARVAFEDRPQLAEPSRRAVGGGFAGRGFVRIGRWREDRFEQQRRVGLAGTARYR